MPLSLLVVASMVTAGVTAPPASATEALTRVKDEADSTFYAGVAYWVAGGALVATGVVTLGLGHPTGSAPANRLALVSGSATLVSGFSSCFSAWPRTLEASALRHLIEAQGGDAALSNEAAARSIVLAHAAWSQTWRRRTLWVTTALLALNAGVLSWYAISSSYQRVPTAIVAGLYGIGVPVVLWYDSQPWFEETALDQVPAPSGGATLPSASLLPMLQQTAQGAALGLGLRLDW
jgi:hypothetical protein